MRIATHLSGRRVGHPTEQDARLRRRQSAALATAAAAAAVTEPDFYRKSKLGFARRKTYKCYRRASTRCRSKAAKRAK